ncbi:MAG: FtsX-like permease family protein [Myxococcales bacterium]|nr:FtsX-like permease family protein [Myxococcales bacterium]
MLTRPLVLARIAFANILSSALNVFVGLVLLFGAALLVIVGSIFGTLDGALSRSIVDSITGHLQVYGAKSKDPLEIYGKVDGSDSNLSAIEDFKSLKAKLLAVPNVKQVVPMGAATAILTPGNTVDVVLEKLRALYRNQQDPKTALPKDEFDSQVRNAQQHVRNIVEVLTEDLQRAKELSSATLEPGEEQALAETSRPAFWDTFDEDPFARLELLENGIAPLATEGDMLFLRYVGTDLDAYQSTFDRMVIVEGGKVPTGHRGLLLPRFFREEWLKLKNARRLDKIRDALATGRTLADTEDKELQRFVRENQSQPREILLQLDGLRTAELVGKLQGLLASTERDPARLLHAFFAVTDENFQARYDWFYKEVAPMLTLYRARIGDLVTLKSIGRSGGMEATAVRLYGIFEYSGLEKSPLAGVNAMVDIVTFRDLYGFLTPEKKAELEAMKASAHATEVAREDAEAALFGGDTELVASVDDKAFAQAAKVADVEKLGGEDSAKERARRRSETFDPAAVDDGVVLNAAIVLADGSPLEQLRTQDAIEKVLAQDKAPPDPKAIADAKALLSSGRVGGGLSWALGSVVEKEEARAKGEAPATTSALLDLQAALKAERAALEPADVDVVKRLLDSARPKVWVVGWSSAAGFLGKFIDFFRMLLVGVVATFAFIALLVVTIGMTIATLQRTQTIGTMRAIGAQRTFVMGMVLTETAVLALVFGLLGALIGAGVVEWLHASGIPAFRDELYFFFSGPVLRPELTAGGFVLALVVTLVVSVLAVIFPTILATRVAPVTAMQETA